VTVSVSCKDSSGATCDVNASLTAEETRDGGRVIAVSSKAKVTHRTVTLGTKTVTIDAGQSQTVTVSLNATGIKLLKSHHKLRVKLSMTSGGSPVASQTVEFTQSKKKKN
jgi:hypothetical protein